jgi:hypothetical protein
MAILQVYIPKRIDDGRLMRNLAGAAEFLAVGTSVRLAKEALYSSGLKPANPELLTKEDLLSFGEKGLYGQDARNTIFLVAPESDIITLMSGTIDVGLRNTIVKTPLTGRKGTVKEHVCAEDYTVEISGDLVGNTQNAYPLEELRELVKLIETEGQIEIASVFLEAFDIRTCVLEWYKIPQKGAKFANTQNFTLYFLSDTPVDLKTIE